MNLKRTKPPVDEAVSTEDRLTGYTATRVPAGVGQTGLPAAARRPATVPGSTITPIPAEAPPMPMPAALHPVAERRDEERFLTTIAVRAGHPHSATVIEGVTVDISTSGMCLQMPAAPPSAHQDVVVENGDAKSILWAQVLGYRDAPDGDGYLWHVRVTAADDAWTALVDAAEVAQLAEVAELEAAKPDAPRRRRQSASSRRSKRSA